MPWIYFICFLFAFYATILLFFNFISLYLFFYFCLFMPRIYLFIYLFIFLFIVTSFKIMEIIDI